MKKSRIENTQNWLESYIYGNNLRDMPELNLDEALAQIKAKSIIMLPEFNGVSALVLSFKKAGTLLLVPISEYAHPANDFEVFLPSSNMVLQTWNARVVEKQSLGQSLNMAMLSDEDMLIAQSHYLAVFGEQDFNFPDLIGESISVLDPNLAEAVLSYINAESEFLPEDIFVVLDADLTSCIFKEVKEEDFKVNEQAMEAIVMPELRDFDSALNLRNAAKPKKK